MRVLVTGGAGFIGSNIANELHRQGHTVTALDNEFLGWRRNLTKEIEYMKMSVTNPNLDVLFDECKFDWVVHMAAYSSAPMFKPNPTKGLKTNIMGFQNIMEQSRLHDVKKVVYASSSSVYSGNPMPFHEGQIVRVKTPYEASMFCRESIARMYFNDFGLKSVGMRFFSVYGQNEKHKGQYANLVSQFLWAVRDHKPIVVYEGGRQTRDFVYVKDVTDACIFSLKQSIQGIYNVGTGESHSINDMIKLLEEALDRKIKKTYVPTPIKNYVVNTQADVSKLKNEGWQAKFDLRKGLADLVGDNHETDGQV